MSLAEKLEVRGEVRGEANILIQLLEVKFGPVSELNQRRIKSADSETLLRWHHQLGQWGQSRIK